MAQILDLGKIRFNWAGTYSSTTQYEYNDLVKYGPNLYAFTSASAQTGVVPTNAGFWTSVVEGFNFRSSYATGTLYYVNDVVTDGVSAFICTVQHTSSDADVNDNENFTLFALGQSDLPSQLSAVNKVLSSDGTDTFWTGTTYLTKSYLGSGQGQSAVSVETNSGLTNAVSVVATNANDFSQFAFTNTSNDASASTDFIAYTNTGDNNSGFIDMGITSNQFEDPAFTITGANDGYIFMSGPRGDTKAVLLKQVLSGAATLTTSGAHGYAIGDIVRVEGVSEELDGQKTITAVPTVNKFSFAAAGLAPFVETDVDPIGSVYAPVGNGNLVLATDESGLSNAIVFGAGGFYSNNFQMAIYPNDKVAIDIDTASISPTTGALVVTGGVGISGELNVSDTSYFGSGAYAFETSAGLTDAVYVAKGSSESFTQLAFVNSLNLPESSADVIVYSVAGDNDAGWIDMGITNPAFDSNTYGITGAGDGYIFMSGVAERSATASTRSISSNVATIATVAAHGIFVGDTVTITGDPSINGTHTVTNTPSPTSFSFVLSGASYSAVSTNAAITISGGKGNLVLATSDSGTENKIIIAAGGLASGNEQMVITPDQNVNISISTASTTPNTGALTVDGGFGLLGNLNAQGDLGVEGFAAIGNGAKAFSDSADLTNPVAVFKFDNDSTDNSFAQIAFTNADSSSSTDIQVFMDNGDDSEGWIDMGMAGSSFADPEYPITYAGDGYIFVKGKDGYSGNLVFGTGNTGTDNHILFAAGGYDSGNTQMVIIPDDRIHVEIATQSTSPTTGALTVVGGLGVSGNVNVAGNVNIAGTITFGGGGTTVETENLAVTDPMVFVGTDNLTDTVDLSFIGEHTYPTTLDPTAAITTKSLTSNVGTLKITYGPSSEPFKVGDSVVIANVDSTFNGTRTVTAVGTSPASISFALTASNVPEAPATTLTSRSVTNKQLDANVATLTTSGSHSFSTGQSVTITNVDATFNGAYTITGTPSSTTFTYAKTAANVPSAPATTSYITTITQKALSSNVATLTTSTSHGYLSGETVVVTDVDSTFNGTFTISAVTSNTFSYGLVDVDIPSVAASGNATVNRLEGAAVATQLLGTANSTDVFRPRFTGLSRDASDGKYKLFDLAKTKPSTTVNFEESGLVYSTLVAKSIEATAAASTFSSITITGTPSADTDAVTIAKVRELVGAWVTKTSAYTAVNGDAIFANTTSGVFTITLPATPSIGNRVRISDIAGKWDTANLTVARNGQNIMGLADNLILNIKNATVDLVYSDSTNGWRLT